MFVSYVLSNIYVGIVYVIICLNFIGKKMNCGFILLVDYYWCYSVVYSYYRWLKKCLVDSLGKGFFLLEVF